MSYKTILAIETSCDETAAAVIEYGRICHANVVASQIPLHQRYGGVVPEIAARAHVEQIFPVIEQALHQSFGPGEAQELLAKHIDALAVTVGPGLVGSLLVGVATAKTLSATLNKPLIPVNHIMGHVYSNFLATSREIEVKSQKSKVKNDGYFFPFLSLIVSGGHTELILSRSHQDHQLIGQTRDDAAGEAFDKAAHLLGLAYPGGPAISAAAQNGDPSAFTLPRGLSKEETLDFSFSGLKTALAQLILKLKADGKNITPLVPDLAASFQAAVVDSLVTKTFKAIEHTHVQYLMLGGGVAANTTLRSALEHKAKQQSITFSCPDLAFCTDNAAMVGAAAYAASLVRGDFDWYDVEVKRNPGLTL